MKNKTSDVIHNDVDYLALKFTQAQRWLFQTLFCISVWPAEVMPVSREVVLTCFNMFHIPALFQHISTQPCRHKSDSGKHTRTSVDVYAYTDSFLSFPNKYFKIKKKRICQNLCEIMLIPPRNWGMETFYRNTELGSVEVLWTLRRGWGGG